MAVDAEIEETQTQFKQFKITSTCELQTQQADTHLLLLSLCVVGLRPKLNSIYVNQCTTFRVVSITYELLQDKTKPIPPLLARVTNVSKQVI